MIRFIQPKTFSQDSFNYYLQKAIETNHFTNYGWAVRKLEERAKDLLKIDDTKAVIATNNGTTAASAIIDAVRRKSENTKKRVCTQDFTFATNSIGSASGSLVVDLNNSCMIDHSNDFINEAADIVIITNCFGHVGDLEQLETILKDKVIVYDNAASPYSFYKGKNCLNYGTASFVSLHHTKPLGFGEGGLVVIDKEYEDLVRAAVNFGMIDGVFNEYGGNYKMSEISAAGILQWWDSIGSFENLASKYRDSYFKLRYELRTLSGDFWPHFGDDNFFPNCLPFIHENPTNIEKLNDREVKKYYRPLRGFPIAQFIYDRISCISITEGL